MYSQSSVATRRYCGKMFNGDFSNVNC